MKDDECVIYTKAFTELLGSLPSTWEDRTRGLDAEEAKKLVASLRDLEDRSKHLRMAISRAQEPTLSKEAREWAINKLVESETVELVDFDVTELTPGWLRDGMLGYNDFTDRGLINALAESYDPDDDEEFFTTEWVDNPSDEIKAEIKAHPTWIEVTKNKSEEGGV